MKTLAFNEELEYTSDSWGETDQKVSGIVIGNNTGKVVQQVLEENKIPELVFTDNYEGEVKLVNEGIELNLLAEGEAPLEMDVINVSKTNNGTNVFGGEGLAIFQVKGANEVEVNHGKTTTGTEAITPAIGLGVVNIGVGSSNIAYKGGQSQDVVVLQNDSGDACVIDAGAGNDIITVQAGKEHVLSGGVGNDKYVIDTLVAGGNYRIIQTEAGSNDRDTLNLSTFNSTDFFVEASNGKDIILTHKNGAQIIIEDWYNSPLTNVSFSDVRARISGLGQCKAYNNYNLKLAGSYSFSGDNSVTAANGTLKNNSNMDRLTVSGNNNTIFVNGGKVTVTDGSYNVIDNSVNKGEVIVYGGDHLTFQGGSGVDLLKIYGGTDMVANMGTGKDQVEVYGGSENTIIFGGGEELKKLVFNEAAGDNYNVVADTTINEIEVKGGNSHTITCGAYADKITINNADGKDYIINTGDGDDYVFIKAGHVKQLEMGQGYQTLVLENGVVDSIKTQGEITTVIRGGVIYIDEKTTKLPVLEAGDNTVYFTNVNLKEYKGGLGNDTFVLNSGYVGSLMGDKGSDTYIFNHIENNREYVINQHLSNGMNPINGEKDSLVLNNYDSTSFAVSKDNNGDVLLTNTDTNSVIRIEGWQENALDNVVFRDKEVSGRTIDVAAGTNGEGVSQLQIIRDFMNAMDNTSAYGNRAFDAAVVECSRGLYTSAQDLVDHFIDDCVNYGGTSYATQKKFLLDYCGINLDNTDTGAISGADAGGPLVKTASSVVAEPKGMTLSDLVYDYTDTIEAYDYFSHTTRTFTCAKVNCNGDPVTFYWDEDKVQMLVDRGLIATREQLNSIIAGVIDAWSEASFNLIAESYGMSLTEEGSELYTAPDGSKAIMLVLDYASPATGSLYINGMSSGWLAAVSSTFGPSIITSGQSYAPGVKEAMLINTYYYKGGFRDINGQPSASSITSQYLDRVIAHELVHGTMAANINGFGSLPSFLKEGLAELVHGVDDVRYSEILDIAYKNWTIQYMSDGHIEHQIDQLKKIFDLSASTNYMGTYTYGGGYALLRYLAKTSSDYSKNLSWGDFYCDGYMEELSNAEMSFTTEQTGFDQDYTYIYMAPTNEQEYKITSNC